jgi:hypothetical protein
MKPLKINIIKIGFRWIGDPDFDLISKHFTQIKSFGDSKVFKLFQEEKAIATIKICTKDTFDKYDKEYANMIIIADNAKEIEIKVLNLIKCEIISHEITYTGNIGFNLDLDILPNIVTKSLAKKDIETKCTQSLGLNDFRIYRPVHLKINPKSIDCSFRWKPSIHCCFERSFHLVVKELLLITNRSLFWLPKEILLGNIIPLLADFEQKKYHGKRGTNLHRNTGELTNWVHQMTFHKNGNVSTMGMVNYTAMNIIFYHIRNMRKDVERQLTPE